MTLGEKLEKRSARLCVIGQGYVGLPVALEFARAGFRVTGIDTDRARVGALRVGESHVPDLDATLFRAVLASGNYSATADLEPLAEADALIICVPTPLGKAKDPDMSFVLSAAGEIARRMRPGQLIVLESTTYPGTTEEVLLPMFREHGGMAGRDFFLAFSPERIDPGNRHYRVSDIPKVVGGVTPACTAMAALLYRQIVREVFPVSSAVVAELAKLYENTFRSVNIALANELALICHRLGVSVWEVVDAAATKPFGFMPFYPGPGIGGHCVPVDPMYLAWKVRLNNYEARFIALADEVNRSMPRWVVERLADALNDEAKCVRGSGVLVLGVAYKADVGDVREAPAVEVIGELQRRGARVSYADPLVAALRVGEAELKRVDPTPDVVRRADAVVILTDHRAFDYAAILADARLVFDARDAIRRRGATAVGARVVRL